jgi:phage FluMu protein Com
MILNHKCLECGFEGEIEVIGRKVECPGCKTVNDFWLDGEIPPPNHRV